MYNKLKEPTAVNDLDLPKDNTIIRMQTGTNTHVAAYRNGFIHDTWICTLKNPKVLGYWVKERES